MISPIKGSSGSKEAVFFTQALGLSGLAYKRTGDVAISLS